MSTDKCYDNDDSNTVWLDDIGRACKYYELYPDDCDNIEYLANSNITNATFLPDNHPCCTCRGERSSSIYNINPECSDVEVWAYVVVAFCLLLACILSMSFYFVCHLFRFVTVLNVQNIWIIHK